MAIQQGDIVLVESQVMDDVPEGGGGPTANVIADGKSNGIFSDIPEAYFALGRVLISKIFAHVQTDDRDKYLGANFILSEPPEDPLISVTAFEASEFFDVRDDARARLEAYLAPGSLYNGVLFGNHLRGQKTLTLLQPVISSLPVVDATLVLKKHADATDEEKQFVRVTEASGVAREFEDGQGKYKMQVVTLGISDPLKIDFPGFDVSRYPTPFADQARRTTVYETIVADAAKYYGVVPLSAPASLGDFVIQAEDIYVSIVPSAQVETPIADARTNQTTAGYVPTGDGMAQNIAATFTTTQALHLGGAIMPSSLSIAASGVTLTDSGGALYSGATQVGQIDCENGIATLSTNVFGTGGQVFAVAYTPAAVPSFVSQSFGIPITIENRRLNFVVTLDPPPARGSLSASFLVAGRWYVLRDDGSGAVRSSSPSDGVGNMNFTSRTLTLTLGALPDVGSAVILQYVEAVAAEKYPASDLLEGGRLHHAISTTHQAVASSMVVSWHGADPLVELTASADADGVITGAATGKVGINGLTISPSILPPAGTIYKLSYDKFENGYTQFSDQLGSAGEGFVKFSTGEGASGYLTFSIPVVLPTRRVNNAMDYRSTTLNYSGSSGSQVKLTGAGEAVLSSVVMGNGVYNAETHEVMISAQVSIYLSIPSYSTKEISPGTWALALDGYERLLQDVVLVPGATVTGQQVAGTSAPVEEFVTPTQLQLRASIGDGKALSGVRFDHAGNHYSYTAQSDKLLRNPSEVDGAGTEVGIIGAYTGIVTLTTWAAGVAPVISNWRAALAPPTAGLNSPFLVDRVMFRTAAAPLRTGSIAVLGTTETGVEFNVQSDSHGDFTWSNSGGAEGLTGTVDASTGLVILEFSTPVRPDTLRYNAVSYTYLPLDANLIGLDPVCLPTNGRVPIFKAGSVVVIGHTGTIPAAVVSAGQTLNCGRVRLSRVRVVGSDGETINSGYSADLEAGTVTFENVTGYAQPVKVEHRIEDMTLVSDVQINGTMRLQRPLTHNYPAGSFVSSAIMLGDVFARVSLGFDQQSWDGVSWSDAVQGNPAVATYNDTLAPMVVTDRGALTERWVFQLQTNTTFRAIGEHVGVIGTGSINEDFAPINPSTGVPYFVLPALGWGQGWVPGNIVRRNTIAAMRPIVLVCTVRQGTPTFINHNFGMLARGGVNRP